MADMPMTDSVRWWLRMAGQQPAKPPAAFFTPDGQPRKAEAAIPRAEATGSTVDYAEMIRLRKEQDVGLANAMRRTFGTFAGRGGDHVYLQDVRDPIAPLSPEIGVDLAGALYS